MRKLVLIAMLVVSTLAWADGGKKADNQSRAGNDWYQATLDRHIDNFVAQSQTTAPSVAGETQGFQRPGSMAAEQGGRGSDWYDQKVKIAEEASRRDLKALNSAR